MLVLIFSLTDNQTPRIDNLNRGCSFLFFFIFYNRKILINVTNTLINYILRNVVFTK